MTSRPTWLPDAAIAAVVLVLGAWEAFDRATEYSTTLGVVPADEIAPMLFVVAFTAVAAGLHRLAPGFALGLVWVSGGLQVITGTEVLYVQLAVVVVAFGCARYGSIPVVWLSGLAIPLAALVASIYVIGNGRDIISRIGLPIAEATGRYDLARPLFLGVVALLILAVPWLAGLIFRVREQARRSREQEQVAVASQRQAEEIAALREQQTRLAHDVHDVVGHSLAVILAQAESAQFVPDDDPAKLKETMANIATSARESLRDVRQVLSGTPGAAHQGGLDELIDGVHGEVRSTVVGTPRPLPPEIESVAYRTMQEMLTNAIKHGVPGEPLTVLRHWADELTLSVQNTATATHNEGGLGLAGMRLRLESIGGRLDVRHEGDQFTATAVLPTRAGMLAR